MQSGPNYSVEAVDRACRILRAFRSESETLRLSEIADRVNLSRPTVFRLLYTLEQNSMLERVGNHEYRLSIRPLKPRHWRLGYGSHSSEFAFSRTVAEGLVAAAREQGVDLLVLDNRYSTKTAIRNVETFIRERVDLIVEFQADEHFAAPVISTKLMEAGIPLIAVEIPHPGATYFGANNYLAGLIGGRHLGRWARQRWAGQVDELLLLELPMSGPIPAARLAGTLVGVRELLPHLSDRSVVHLDGRGRFGPSLEAVRKHIRHSRAQFVLAGAINDPSAIGALRAFEEAGRADGCAVVGQNASAESRIELRRPGTRLIGSVGYFPESYGSKIIAIALDILAHKPVPPAVFTHHQLVTPGNVDHLYPNDVMLLSNELDTLLLRQN